MQPLTEGVGEWRLATLQHTLSSERETLLSAGVFHALEKCVSARKLATEGGLDGGRWGQRQSATAAPRPTSPRAQKLCCTSSEDVTYIFRRCTYIFSPLDTVVSPHSGRLRVGLAPPSHTYP